MKKFQAMMAVVLVAMMVLVVTSCGKDDDDNSKRYTIEFSLKIDEPGNLTNEQCQQLIYATKQKSGVSDRADDATAEKATQYAAELVAESMELDKEEYGDAVMTVTVECKRASNNERVAIYYVTYNKGDVTITNGKN